MIWEAIKLKKAYGPPKESYTYGCALHVEVSGDVNPLWVRDE